MDNKEEHRIKTPNDNSKRTNNELWPKLVECKGYNLIRVKICKTKNKKLQIAVKSLPLYSVTISSSTIEIRVILI